MFMSPPFVEPATYLRNGSEVKDREDRKDRGPDRGPGTGRGPGTEVARGTGDGKIEKAASFLIGIW